MTEFLFTNDADLREEGQGIANVSTELPIEYPHERLEGQKPLVSVIANATMGEAYHNLLHKLGQGEWSDTWVTTYLVTYMTTGAQFQSRSDRAWTASAIPICEAAADITPVDLLRTVPVQDDLFEREPADPEADDALQINQGSDNERLSLFLCLITMYRKSLATSSPGDYGDVLRVRINAFLMQNWPVVVEDDLNATQALAKDSNMTRDYKRVLCAIDMFFTKFRDHPLSKITIGTCVTRYHGCVALTAIRNVAKVLGYTPGQLLQFVITKPVAMDAKQVMKPGQHAEDPYSYFPYHLDLGLVKRSAYSLSANPALCVWLHVIGIMLGLERHRKAVMPLVPPDLTTTCHTAMVTAFLTGGKGDLKRRWWATNEDQLRQTRRDERARAAEQADAPADELEENDPFSLLIIDIIEMAGMDELPEACMQQIRMSANNCAVHNPGSVGQYIYQNYSTLAMRRQLIVDQQIIQAMQEQQ